jgi:tetratricopeptide (TPR) repeat protein
MDDAGIDDTVDQWLEVARDLLGEGDDAAILARADHAVDQALLRAPGHAPAWIVKCQIAAARGDDIAALAAAEAAVAHAPTWAVAHYWRGALLGDLGHGLAALAAIERAFLHLGEDDDWLLEDLFFEKATLYDALGDREAAAATYRAGLARCPTSTLLRVGAEPMSQPPRSPVLKVLRGGLD